MNLSLALVLALAQLAPPGPPSPYFNELMDVAGLAGTPGHTDGPGLTTARFAAPRAITSVPSGTSWVVTDGTVVGTTSIRMINAYGDVTTTAVLLYPSETVSGLVADPVNNQLYVSVARWHVVVRIPASGGVFSFVGASVPTTGCPQPPCFAGGFANGVASQARFNAPSGLAIDANRQLYIADTLNGAIRKSDVGGFVTTILQPGNLSPSALAVDQPRSRLLFTSGNALFSIPLTGGSPTWLAGDMGPTSLFGRMIDGDLSVARFANARGIAVDAAGNIFVADSESQVIFTAGGGIAFVQLGAIRQVTPAFNGRWSYPSFVSTLSLAPGWIPGTTWANGHASDTTLRSPIGLAWFGNALLVSDTQRQTVRRIQAAPIPLRL